MRAFGRGTGARGIDGRRRRGHLRRRARRGRGPRIADGRSAGQVATLDHEGTRGGGRCEGPRHAPPFRERRGPRLGAGARSGPFGRERDRCSSWPRGCTTSARSASLTPCCTREESSTRRSGRRSKSIRFSASGSSTPRASTRYCRLCGTTTNDGTAPDTRTGLLGTEIPLDARILAVCDAYESMTAPRSYGGSLTLEEAIAEIELCAGTQFDPDIAAAFSPHDPAGAPDVAEGPGRHGRAKRHRAGVKSPGPSRGEADESRDVAWLLGTLPSRLLGCAVTPSS